MSVEQLAESDVLAFEADQVQRPAYQDLGELYRELGTIDEQPLPPRAVNRVLRRLPDWSHQVQGVNPAVHTLSMAVMDLSLQLHTYDKPTPGRSFHRDRETGSLVLRVADDDLRVKDFKALLWLEGQYPESLRTKDAAVSVEESAQQTAEPAAEFQATEGIYLQEGDIFTDTETVLLRYATHYATQLELAEGLGAGPNKINALLKSMRNRAGIDPTKGSVDAYIELTLLALSLEIATVDHIAKRNTANLAKSDRQLLVGYFNFDSAEREAFRSAYSEAALSMRWSNLYKRLRQVGVENRHTAVLYAVRNEILTLPDAADARERLARISEET